MMEMIDNKYNKLNEDLDDEDLDDEDEDEDDDKEDEESEDSLNITPKDLYVLFKGDKNFYAQAANLLYDWYDMEGAFEDFSSKQAFLDFVRSDIYDMLDAADTDDAIIVKKALGIYDPEEYEDEEDLEESFKSKDRYSVLREALDRLDEEDNKAKRAKAKIKSLRSRLKA